MGMRPSNNENILLTLHNSRIRSIINNLWSHFSHVTGSSIHTDDTLARLEHIEWLQGVWPKIISVAMEMPIFYVNFSSLNYPNLNDESLGPYG